MFVLVIPVILLQTKRKRNTKYHKPSKKTKLSKLMTKFPPSLKRRHKKKKITDWITSQKPICRRHPINLNNNITDISQKKICQKALKIQNLSLIFVIQTMKFRLLNLKSWSCQLYTRCTKYFWMTSKTVIIWVNHVFLKGRNTKCFRVKANKTTIIPSKISSANECKPSHSFPDLSSLKYLNMNIQSNTLTKSHSTKALKMWDPNLSRVLTNDFSNTWLFYASRTVQSSRTARW
jgi:hypothetical protein